MKLGMVLTILSTLVLIPFSDLAGAALDAAGFAKPTTNLDQLTSAVTGGATAGLLTGGAARSLTGLPGVAGKVAESIAGSPHPRCYIWCVLWLVLGRLLNKMVLAPGVNLLLV